MALAYSLGPLTGGYLVQAIGFKVTRAPKSPVAPLLTSQYTIAKHFVMGILILVIYCHHFHHQQLPPEPNQQHDIRWALSRRWCGVLVSSTLSSVQSFSFSGDYISLKQWLLGIRSIIIDNAPKVCPTNHQTVLFSRSRQLKYSLVWLLVKSSFLSDRLTLRHLRKARFLPIFTPEVISATYQLILFTVTKKLFLAKSLSCCW